MYYISDSMIQYPPSYRYWTDSVTGTSGADGTFQSSPIATLAATLARCTAGHSDVIVCSPRHVETVIASGGLDIGVEGVVVRGLGTGSLRPTILFTTSTAAKMNVTGDNVLIENLIFDFTGIDAVAEGLDITGTGVTFSRCRFITGGATGQCTLPVTATVADRLRFVNCEFIGSGDAGTTAALTLYGGDDIEIAQCTFRGYYAASVGAVQVLTTAVTNLYIRDTLLANYTAASSNAFKLLAGTTGVIDRCTAVVVDNAAVAGTDTLGDAVVSNSRVINNVGEAAAAWGA